jgi:hypothetical protein
MVIWVKISAKVIHQHRSLCLKTIVGRTQRIIEMKS